jgi:hypothetical protein
MRLEEYLREAQKEGDLVDQGTFTLAREKALDKLANFALPFEGAWAVKLIQAAVSSGIDSGITVRLGRRETRFTFTATERWTLDAIEEAFFAPELRTDVSLNHFKLALWSLGIEGRRAFQVALPDDPEMLIWNGVRLRRVKRDRDYQTFYFALTPLGVGASTSTWIGRSLLTSERNAELPRILTEHCCTCPVPLTVDGRRIDGIERLPRRGWDETSFPLCILPVEGTRPPLRIPQGTLEQKGFGKAQGVVMKGATSSHPGLIVMATATLNRQGRNWVERKEPSLLVWVQDGAIVQSEPIHLHPSSCCATLFLSADGIETDLTQFQLLDSTEKRRRREVALPLAAQALWSQSPLSTDGIRVGGSRTGGVGATLFLMGTGLSLFAPGIGTFVLASVVVGTTLAVREKRQLEEWIISEFEQLVRRFQAGYGSRANGH